MRTLQEVFKEVQEVIETNPLVESRLQQLKARGYKIELNWVKNGDVGSVFLMKNKQVRRVQVSPSEKFGRYHKAYCIVIPFSEVALNMTN